MIKLSAYAITTGAVRNWVFLYTAGLPSEIRKARRAELESDIWEQRQEETGPVLHMLLRLVLGAPSDMAWRLETGAAVRNSRKPDRQSNSWTAKRGVMNSEQTSRIFVALVLLLALYQVAIALLSAGWGLGILDIANEESPGNGWFITLPISAIGLPFIWAGMRQRLQAPKRAGVLIAVGVLPSILMFWMMLPPIIALGVAIYAVFNGRSQQRQLDAST